MKDKRPQRVITFKDGGWFKQDKIIIRYLLNKDKTRIVEYNIPEDIIDLIMDVIIYER